MAGHRGQLANEDTLNLVTSLTPVIILSSMTLTTAINNSLAKDVIDTSGEVKIKPVINNQTTGDKTVETLSICPYLEIIILKNNFISVSILQPNRI